MTSTDLTSLLHSAFRFPAFRVNQEAVCAALVDGRDALLVMPTGAGKSLCYQLPAIARGGTALVISPLIALMEDQAAKLDALGFRVARIHSGLSREDSRQACRRYLDGELQFLFIAPERMRVPGFPQMLARHKPTLVAIDEAHCISHWGHDFRPDYRTLGQHLPALRPAPIIALTATATPTVQRDIVNQLQLNAPELFIHGFRRSNLAIEVVETPKPLRGAVSRKLLDSAERRPAIIYAPSRKQADELAAELSAFFPSAAYHAGLDAGLRERVQSKFQTGKLEVVVATIAFGMGIDKADVRTVIHTALPASVEAYYQEIGRAGRDGLPSRTVLLHSFQDRRMHDFFLDRDYPPPSELQKIFDRLITTQRPGEMLRFALKMDAEVFDKALEKLWSNGGCLVDYDGNVTLGAPGWLASYSAQLEHRRGQAARMAEFADSPQCRMAALVQHFGDAGDAGRLCGQCDFCSPETSIVQQFRNPTADEERALRRILAELRDGGSKSTGKLHTEIYPKGDVDRNGFEDMLKALARAGFLQIENATFESKDDGRSIAYRRAVLTHEGRELRASDSLPVQIKDVPETDPAKGTRARPSKKTSASKAKTTEPTMNPVQAALAEALRAWRREEARKLGQPAFCVFGDKTLQAIAMERPRNLDDLTGIHGMGPAKITKFGDGVCRVCNA